MHVLKGVQLANGKRTDITIESGAVSKIGKSQTAGLDCSGLMALPGFVDLHTHLRQPGYEASETVLSGSRSGVAGGYTALFAMANSDPVADNASVVEQVMTLGEEAGLLEVRPIGAVTKNLSGTELSALGMMANSAARVRVFSDDGHCVHDPLVMQRALTYVKGLGGVIAQHAQEPRLTEGSQMNASPLSTELGLKGWPSVAEESIIARDALLAEQIGARLHICHLTTAGAVDVVRWAKARGIDITAEVTPHHLMLTEDLVRSYDPVYKVNPPLRAKEDTLALREALLDGTIDIIGTDHAPHSSEKKDCEWEQAAFGMVGLEHAASVAQSVLIDSGASDWDQLSEVMSSKPAEIGSLVGHGAIEEGKPANIVLLDPSAKRVIQTATHSLSTNNPFAGHELSGAVVHTIFRGQFSLRDGKVANA
jgi:dihydroorotase